MADLDFPTVRSIEIFVALAKSKNTAATAKKFGLTTMRIRSATRQIEQTLNVSLFDRNSPLVLSAAGLALVPVFRRYLKTIRDAKKTVAATRHLSDPYESLRVGARPEIIDRYWGELEIRYPNKKLVKVLVDHEFEFVPYMRERKIDMSIGFNPIPMDWMDQQEFIEVRTGISCTNLENFATFTEIPLGWVEGYQVKEERTLELGKPVYPAWCFDNLESLRIAVESGVVVGRLPDWAAPKGLFVAEEKTKLFSHRRRPRLYTEVERKPR